MENEGEPATPVKLRPLRVMRRARLDELIQAVGGPKAFADTVGTKDTHIIAIAKGRREIGDDLATKIEEKCGKPFGWMDSVASLSAEAMEIALALDKLQGEERSRAVSVCRLASMADVPPAQPPAQTLGSEPAPSPSTPPTPAPSRAK